MTERSPATAGRKAMLYGRRRGRPLRVGQRTLFDTVLPGLRIEVPEAGSFDPFALFAPRPQAIWLEIGFGGGEHVAAQAQAHPGIGILAGEVYENGVAKLLAQVARQGLGNVRILPDDARPLLTALPDASIGRAFILFPDPWPKLRHHKRRIVSAETLASLARIMTDGAELRIATDDRDYLRWILERVTQHPDFAWQVRGPADWRTRPADWPPTRYELKAIAAGRPPTFLRLIRRPRNAVGHCLRHVGGPAPEGSPGRHGGHGEEDTLPGRGAA